MAKAIDDTTSSTTESLVNRLCSSRRRLPARPTTTSVETWRWQPYVRGGPSGAPHWPAGNPVQEMAGSYEMVKLSALALAMALTDYATVSDIYVALEAWGDCVISAVKRLDDGKSFPIEIAYRVAPQCADLYARLTETMIRQYKIKEDQTNMRGVMKDGEIRLIISAILMYRNPPTRR